MLFISKHVIYIKKCYLYQNVGEFHQQINRIGGARRFFTSPADHTTEFGQGGVGIDRYSV